LEISADDIVETVRSALLVLDENLVVQSANRAFYRTFGVTPEASIGRTVYDLGNGQWDIPALRRLLEEVIPSHEVVEAYEVDHIFETIGQRSFVLNARKVFRPGNGVPFLLLALDDVTETRKAEVERDRTLKLAETIVATVRDPLVILEGDMTVVTANRSFLQLFGVTDAQIAGRPVGELGEGQWGVATLRDLLLRVVPDSEAFDGYEIEDEFPGLGRRIFKLNARKIFRPGDDVTRLLVVFEDVTEARLLERHRDVLAAELAHRIKNNLQIITSFVAFEIRRAAEPCVEGYRAMRARIGAVAELYDVISRSAVFGPVPAEDYLNGIAASLRASLVGPESTIVISVTAEPLLISADRAVALGLIVNELATNAVKHAFPAGRGHIILGIARHSEEVVLTVSDDGIGLAAGADSSGSQLGSLFVDAFVRQVGGILTEGSGSNGTTFTVRMPSSVLAED
jgi:PAS domain S-box-containing protein